MTTRQGCSLSCRPKAWGRFSVGFPCWLDSTFSVLRVRTPTGEVCVSETTDRLCGRGAESSGSGVVRVRRLRLVSRPYDTERVRYMLCAGQRRVGGGANRSRHGAIKRSCTVAVPAGHCPRRSVAGVCAPPEPSVCRTPVIIPDQLQPPVEPAQPRFLIGFGELLTEPIPPPSRRMDRVSPYSLDIHYNARELSRVAASPEKIRYAMVITVCAPQTPDLYDRVLRTYATRLEALSTIVDIPVPLRE